MKLRGWSSALFWLAGLGATESLLAAPPTSVVSPLMQPVIVGDYLRTGVETNGTEPLTYQWQKDGVDLPGQTASTLRFVSAKLTDAGSYRVRVSNAEGSLLSPPTNFEVFPESVAPRIIQPLRDLIVAEGETTRFETQITGAGSTSTIWVMVGGDPNPPAFPMEPTLLMAAVQRSRHGSAHVSAFTQVRLGSGTYAFAQQAQIHIAAPGTTTGRIRGTAHRGEAGSGTEALVAGLVIEGDAPRKILFRGSGPALAAHLPAGSVATDPEIEIFNASGQSLGRNDNWDSAGASDITSTSLSLGLAPFPAGAKDSALLLELPAGNYTLHLRNRSGGRGVGMIELFEVNTGDQTRRISATSTRARVGPGNGALIQGLVVEGSTSRRFLIRGLGPKLAEFGVSNPIADPMVEIYRHDGTIPYFRRSNEDWPELVNISTAEVNWHESVFRRLGIPLLARDGKDAAFMTQLPPGVYTVQLRAGTGAPSDSTGIALLEIYELR